MRNDVLGGLRSHDSTTLRNLQRKSKQEEKRVAVGPENGGDIGVTDILQ